jgi:hypothetical protein
MSPDFLRALASMYQVSVCVDFCHPRPRAAVAQVTAWLLPIFRAGSTVRAPGFHFSAVYAAKTTGWIPFSLWCHWSPGSGFCCHWQ